MRLIQEWEKRTWRQSSSCERVLFLAEWCVGFIDAFLDHAAPALAKLAILFIPIFACTEYLVRHLFGSSAVADIATAVLSVYMAEKAWEKIKWWVGRRVIERENAFIAADDNVEKK